MALSKEKQEDFPPQVAENCACLAMRCRDADQMSDLFRVFFLHRIESITKRVKLLVKCLCEYHSTSSFIYYIFTRLTTPDALDKNLILKFMLALGGSSVNLSAFNLNIASSSELSFFKNCTLPANVPEFASESALSRPCKVVLKESQSEKIYASWEKTMLKLHESLNVQVLTDQALMRAMLACKMLILLEVKNGSKAFKINERGRLLLDKVLPCKLDTTKTWPASAMCLYPFFEWIQRNDVVETAVDEFISKNQTTAQNFGYRLEGVKINSPESIIITMVSLKTHDVNNYRCRYDHERCGFVLPVGRGGVLVGTPVLMKLLMLCSMAYVYVHHSNSGNLDRDSLIACMLYHLKLMSTPLGLKKVPLRRIDNLLDEHLSTARTMDITTVVVPLAASDYRTPEGTHKNRKKKLACKVAKPTEKQNIKSFVRTCQNCEDKFKKTRCGTSFTETRDAVVEKLLKKGAKDLKLCVNDIPVDMGARQNSVQNELEECPPAVGDKRKLFAMYSDDEDDDSLAIGPAFSQKKIPITTGKTISKDLMVVKRRKPNSEYANESGSEDEESDSDDANSSEEQCSGTDSNCDSDAEQVPPVTRSQKKSSPLNSPLRSPRMQISPPRTLPNYSESTESMATGSNERYPAWPSDRVQSPPYDDEISVIETGTAPRPMYTKEQGAVMEIQTESLPMHTDEERIAVSSIELPLQENFMPDDVDCLFNGSPYHPDEEKSPDRFINEIVAENFEGPLGMVESEQITNGTVVMDKGRTKILAASFDSAMRGVCMTEILRDIAELEDVVPETKLRHTANGEVVYDVDGENKLLYCLDTYPQKWTTLKNSQKVARLIFMCGALKGLDDTSWKQFRIDGQQCLTWHPPVGDHMCRPLPHPLDVIKSSDMKLKMIELIRSDGEFATWLKKVTERRMEIDEKVKILTRNLQDERNAIDLDFLGRFLNQLTETLPWLI